MRGYERQLQAIHARQVMHDRIDEMPEDTHAVLLIWEPDGRQRLVQMGLSRAGDLGHVIANFLHGFHDGKFNDTE